jgi:hypothetical protein
MTVFGATCPEFQPDQALVSHHNASDVPREQELAEKFRLQF